MSKSKELFMQNREMEMNELGWDAYDADHFYHQNQNSKTTLVIHPDDPSTTFLKYIYQDLPNTTVVTKGKTQDEIIDLIKNHDRIIMLGHGTPQGLMSVGQFPSKGYVINSEVAPYLTNTENIFVWCYASDFVSRYNLEGFSSGMFISEVSEAEYLDVTATQADIDMSNMLFAYTLGKALLNNDDLNIVIGKVKTAYFTIGAINEVAKYNNGRLRLMEKTILQEG
jgi:hypothetical protein